MYIVCTQCKYSFHVNCIKPKLTKKKLLQDDFEFACKSCKKKDRKRLKQKSSEMMSVAHEDELDIDELTQKNPELEDKSMTFDKDSDKEIVVIRSPDNDLPPPESKHADSDRKSSCKKFKIIIDPQTLHDEDMFGGVDRVNQFPNNTTHFCASSTILKSKSDHDSDNYFEEEMEIDETPRARSRMKSPNRSDRMEVDAPQNQSENSSIIKISKDGIIEAKAKAKESVLKIKAQTEDEIVVMEPRYARYLDEIVRLEYLQLEKECEELENKRKDANRKKKTINFMYILQKRLKKRISLRKSKYYQTCDEKGNIQISASKSQKDAISETSPMKRAKSTKISLAKLISRRRLTKLKESPNKKLSKIQELSIEESEGDEYEPIDEKEELSDI